MTKHLLCTFLFILVTSSCALRFSTPADKKRFKKENIAKVTEDEILRSLIRRKFSREGKYSTVSEDFVTTERYVRKNSVTILTLEKGKLRVETEKNHSGRVLTKTWQGDVLTSFMVTRPEKSILVLFDSKGGFLHKIVTRDDEETPECYHYTGKTVVAMNDTECISLIPGFD